MNPVSAMARAAKVVGPKEYKELLLGYASTVRTGGDVLHYLYSQTESMFRWIATKIRSMGQKMGLLMEEYTIIAILGALGLYMIFIVSLSFPTFQASPRTCSSCSRSCCCREYRLHSYTSRIRSR